MLPNRKRNVTRGFWTLGLGFVLGGLLTALANLMPASTARDFLTASVTASFGPFLIDVVSFGITIGPVFFALNVLTLVGVAVVAFVVRSWM